MAILIIMMLAIVGLFVYMFVNAAMESMQMSPEEKKKAARLDALETLYKRGEISYHFYYDEKAKLEGKTTLTDMLGRDDAALFGKQQEYADAIARKEKENRIATVVGSGIGHGVGGLGGAIIGGVSAAAEGKAEMDSLLRNKAIIDEELNKKSKK